MATKRAKAVVPGVYRVGLGLVNAYILIDGEAAAVGVKSIVVVDTGQPGDASRIVAAIGSLGRHVTDVAAIVLTHAHPDHSGSAAALRDITGAPILAHPATAGLLAEGRTLRPFTAAPTLLFRLLVRGFARRGDARTQPLTVDRTIQEGATLSQCGGLRVIDLPGHSAGQIGLYSPRHGGVLIGGDVATNVVGLSYAILYEDFAQGIVSARRVATLGCEVVCLGHGRPLIGGASARFAEVFGR